MLNKQRVRERTLKEFVKQFPRDEAMANAYLSGHHTMVAVAEHFGVHYTTVSRIVKKHEVRGGDDL